MIGTGRRKIATSDISYCIGARQLLNVGHQLERHADLAMIRDHTSCESHAVLNSVRPHGGAAPAREGRARPGVGDKFCSSDSSLHARVARSVRLQLRRTPCRSNRLTSRRRVGGRGRFGCASRFGSLSLGLPSSLRACLADPVVASPTSRNV